MSNMIKTLTTTSILAALTLTGPANADQALKATSVNLLLKGLVERDKNFVKNHTVEDYIQHNPQAKDGRSGLLSFIDFTKTLTPPLSIKPIRILQDGNLVAVHSEYELAGKKVVFDLFRFENGKIVEHWDATQDIPEKTVSGRSMTDGPTEITDRDKTQENRTLVTNFVSDILIKGEGDKITNYISDTYLQHNPNVSDGLEGLGKFLNHLKENNISFSYKKIHNIVAEGNFVMTQSEGEIGGKPNAFYDLFRVENSKIVEHWDVIQEIPSTMPHNNGMF